jgi:hypothetical protein
VSRPSKIKEIIEAAEHMVYAMESSIYFSPSFEDDNVNGYLPKWKRESMQRFRSQEIRALCELKRAVGL